MKFRLIYRGPLPSTQSDNPIGSTKPVKNAKAKHEIRRQFHKQLQRLWLIDNRLKNWKAHGDKIIDYDSYQPIRDHYYTNVTSALEKEKRGNIRDYPPLKSMTELLANEYCMFGYQFCPLVTEKMNLLCSIDILFLRRDNPGSLMSAGDVDNRVKTVIDALRIPRSSQELEGSEKPINGESPFYCLMDDDRRVTHLSVETDILLDPMDDDGADHSQAELVLTIDLKPYVVHALNTHFS